MHRFWICRIHDCVAGAHVGKYIHMNACVDSRYHTDARICKRPNLWIHKFADACFRRGEISEYERILGAHAESVDIQIHTYAHLTADEACKYVSHLKGRKRSSGAYEFGRKRQEWRSLCAFLFFSFFFVFVRNTVARRTGKRRTKY